MTTDEVLPNGVEKNGETNGTEVKRTGIKVIVVGAGTHSPSSSMTYTDTDFDPTWVTANARTDMNTQGSAASQQLSSAIARATTLRSTRPSQSSKFSGTSFPSAPTQDVSSTAGPMARYPRNCERYPLT